MKYTELSKRSKKEQEEFYDEQRDVNPISRTERDRTKYDRKRQRDQARKNKYSSQENFADED